MKNVLWLASWYPGRTDRFNGDFIERHAIAASRYDTITVLCAIRDDSISTRKKCFVEIRKYNDNCSAKILYYRRLSRIRILDKILAGIRYAFLFSRFIDDHIQANGKPDLVHVHVAWRAGLLALYCRWKFKLQYIVTEHWTAFLPEASPSVSEMPAAAKFLIEKIYRRSAACTAVSATLAHALTEHFNFLRPQVIPNVVNTDCFYRVSNRSTIFRFIHVSSFGYQKNPEQLFEAVALLKSAAAQPFNILIVAPEKDKVMALASAFGVEDVVRFSEYQVQPLLAKQISASDALILYSRFETFGCVVIEAMACGIPVIVSDIPVMRELVQDDVTGVLVALNNPQLLAEKMLWMMSNRGHFNPSVLTERAGRYDFEMVGKMFDKLYNS